MDRQPKLTPRTKGAQAAPVGASPRTAIQDPGYPAPEARVVTVDSESRSPSNAKDVCAHVEHQVRVAGRIAFKDNAKLYGMMLIPMGVASLWCFAIFAALSWLVPNVLCEGYAKELSGSSVGIGGCVYVKGGGYFSPYSGSKMFWLLFWAVQALWVPGFPGFVCKAMFGSCMSRVQMIATIFISALAFAVPLVTALVYDMALNNTYVLLTSAFGSLIVVIVISDAAVRYTGNRLMKWRFIFLFSFMGLINTTYLWIMPRLITLQSQDALGGMGLTVIRLFVHPAVWTVVLFYFHSLQRHIGRVKDLTQISFLIWPVIYSSLYGRFLLLQLESAGSVVILNLMFACFHIAGQLSDRGEDQWWLQLLYGYRAKDAIQSSKLIDEMELVTQLTTSMMEGASILGASALLSFGGVATAPGVPPNHGLIWFNAFLQMLTTFLFNFFEIPACGKFHNLEWRKVYPKSVKRFLTYGMIVLTLGGARLCIELLLLFCPKYYDNYGMLLEQCDRPSLFQAISLTTKMPTKGPEDSAPWYPAEYTNGTWITKTEL